MKASVSAAIRAARTAGRLKPWHEPAAAVATKLAGSLDAAELSTMDLTRLSGELDKMLSRLPLAEPGPERSGDDRSGPAAGGAGEGESRTVGLAAVVGSGPEVGDTALPA